jgi:predicted O-methyltransferase YrrM
MKSAFPGLIVAVAAISLPAQPPASSASPTVDEIVARHVQATGGRAAWDKVATQTRKGAALPDSANLPLETMSQAPDKWTFTIRMPNGRTLKHGFDGAQGWEDRGRAVRMERDSALDETLIYDPFWVLRVREHFPRLLLKGIERNGDSEVYVIEATPTEGRTRILFFDVRQGLLTRAGKTMYADYRDAGGVKVPFLVRYGYQSFRFTEIRHGEPVDEARFRMPASPSEPPPALTGGAPKAQENLPSADQLLNKYLAAIGGSQALSRVKTQVRKGVLKEDAESVPVETIAKAPGKWLLVLQTGGPSPDREGYNGAVGWSESADVVKNMDPHEQPELETFLDYQLPLKLESMRAVMTVKGKEKLGQQEVYVVEAVPTKGGRRTLAFDAQTGLLALADSVFFEDYRDIDGLKLPFRIKLHGGQIAVNFTEIRHDVPVEDGRFERPAPSAAFEKNFAGLQDPRALPVLKRVIGQGVSPSDGRMFHDLIVERGYKRALDIGTAEGYAALWLGLAMKRNGGQVITIEIDPETADSARANIRQAGLEGAVDSRINDALAEIPALKGDFDFVFMDTGAPLNKKLFDLLRTRISPGGAILAHNAASFESQQPDFLKAIRGDPSFETKIVPTARGGILFSVKRR